MSLKLPQPVVVFTTWEPTLPSVENRSSIIVSDAGSVGSFEQRGGIAKEVVAEQAAGAEDELGIEVRTGQQLVHVAAVAAHLLGKPRHAAPLLAQRAENHLAEMDVAHATPSVFLARPTPRSRI